MAWVRVHFPQRGNAGRGLGLGGKIVSMNWEVLDLRCLSGFQKETLKCKVEMAQHGWEPQWLIQDVRLKRIHQHWTEDPRVYQQWWCNELESQTQKVQTEAGGQYRLHGPGLQSTVVTCPYFSVDSRGLSITVCVISFWKWYFSQVGRNGDLMPSGILWLSIALTP